MADVLQALAGNLMPIITIVYLLVYAVGMKMLTPIVFKQLTVSKTYVSMTKKDTVLALVWFALFFNALSEIVAYLMVPIDPTLVNIDFLLRALTSLCVLGAGWMASKAFYDFF